MSRGGAAAAAEVGGVAREAVERLGGMTGLALRALATALTRSLAGRETLIQAIFMFRVTVIPIVVVNLLFGGGALGIGAPSVLSQFGALDRAASFAAPGLLREFGVFLTGAVLAGVTGTTITAELGARKIREELDALAALGLDPIREMVVPRILALMLVSVVLLMLGFVSGVVGALMFVTLVHDGPTGAFLPQLLSNTSIVDLYGSVIKAMLFGLLIGIVCCYKGLHCSGGAAGVGRAVNEAVVAALTGVFLLSLVYTYFFLGLYPDATVVR